MGAADGRVVHEPHDALRPHPGRGQVVPVADPSERVAFVAALHREHHELGGRECWERQGESIVGVEVVGVGDDPSLGLVECRRSREQ